MYCHDFDAELSCFSSNFEDFVEKWSDCMGLGRGNFLIDMKILYVVCDFCKYFDNNYGRRILLFVLIVLFLL
jgi:hypothetical protein